MSYTRDYIFEKIIEKLPTLKIHEKKEDDSSIFILEYKNNKAKIDIDSFVKKLGNKKNSLSDKKIDEFIYYIVSNFEAQEKISTSNLNKEDLLEHVFPVVRSTSFNKDNTQNLIKLNHTNETDIYLVYDFENGYKFLDRKVTEQLLISDKELFDFAKGNLEKLSLKYNKDSVQGNDFYFLNAKDGYDGARVIDKNILDYFYKKIGASYYLGLPHQDVLIIADIKNKKGLHARPSSLFVQLVTKYDSDISVKSEDETVNGKSIMGLMLLAAEEGRELELIADGPDEDAMLKELVDLIEVKKFNEE